MKLDELTIGEAKALASMFGEAKQAAPFVVGCNYGFRTVTHIVSGRVVAVSGDYVTVTDAAWIASTGRYSGAVASGDFDEVEPYPEGAEIIINAGALIDAFPLSKLPREQK